MRSCILQNLKFTCSVSIITWASLYQMCNSRFKLLNAHSVITNARFLLPSRQTCSGMLRHTPKKKIWFTVILSESKHVNTMRFESIVSSFAYSCCSGSSVLSFDSNKMTWLLLLFTHYFFRCSNLSISSVSGEIRETMGIFIAVSWESNRFPERSAKKSSASISVSFTWISERKATKAVNCAVN